MAQVLLLCFRGSALVAWVSWLGFLAQVCGLVFVVQLLWLRFYCLALLAQVLWLGFCGSALVARLPWFSSHGWVFVAVTTKVVNS